MTQQAGVDGTVPPAVKSVAGHTQVTQQTQKI